eukprot:CAMPEP_0168349724 /NCGR_PEP_ID=MMETSP0213-20121227/20612_1 /TAXON_ID=151035 /ORGANISM="Euplotes harpa, Strain FSP1.4" /LENGTH=339 /DNA_ID=CAMNT_0008359771 /DNA_START=670 /DNA_END=1686 /DNA_ORIENTATION=+
MNQRILCAQIDDKKLTRTQTLDSKATKNEANNSNNGFTPSIRNRNRDLDPIEDALKTGYSQKSRIEGNTTFTKELPNVNKISSKPKAYTNALSSKLPQEGKTISKLEQAYKQIIENPHGEEEVNRILGVLQRNLDKKPGAIIGSVHPGQSDPKRDDIRLRLHRHLQMKEEQKDNSKTIVFNADKDFEIQSKSSEQQELLKGFSDLFSKFEVPHDKGDGDNDLGPCHYMHYQPSKGETLQFLPDYDVLTQHDQKTDYKEISVQFENISKISHSSSSEDLAAEKPQGVSKMVAQYTSENTEMNSKKLRTILALMQLYAMVKSKNPYNFSQILKIWSALKMR